MVTGDWNILQLVSKQTKVCIIETSSGKTIFRDYGIDIVQEEYQFTPEFLCTLPVLTEIAHIGKKTAINLLCTYVAKEDLLEELYVHLEELPQKSIREKLLQNKEDVLQNKESWKIFKNTIVDFSLEKTAFTGGICFQWRLMLC